MCNRGTSHRRMVVKGKAKLVNFTVDQLLNAISTFLNSDGGLKSEEDCVKLNNCMRQLGGSMQDICSYLNVINATEDDAVLSKLLEAGAWETLHEWLNEYKELDEAPVLILLLETFQKLPVSMDLLKANTTAKIIKSLRKHTDEEVKTKAGETVDKWMQLIKSKTTPSTPVSTKNGEHKEKEKKKKRHKHSSGDKEEPKKVPPSPQKESSVDRDVPSPPPPAIFKDSSKSTNGDKLDKSTAKQHTVKERSAGVEAGIIKPKPRGSKPSKAAAGKSQTASPSAASSHKRVNIELPGLSELSSNSGSKKPKIDPNQEEDFGKAKLIAPLPKPAHIVQDSGGFMEALMQPRTPVMVKKKRNNSHKTPTSPTEKTSPPNTPMSPVSAPPSFYKDTLEGPSGASPTRPPSGDSSDRMSPVESTVSSNSNADDSKAEPMDTSISKPAKKKVSWKAEKELREFHYFELLDDERVNVNRLRDQGGFDEMKKREMLSDRAVIKNIQMEEKGLKHSNAPAKVTDKFPWKTPVLIELPAPKFTPGHLSAEKQVQTERELKVLAALYFDKASTPSTATEPDNTADMEPSNLEPMLNIPLEVNGDSTPMDTFQPEPETVPAPAPKTALLEAPSSGGTSVSDLVPGVTANDMDLIQKLANGEGGHELLEVLANTNPEYVNQIMQTQGISGLDNSGYPEENNDMAPRGVPPPSLLGDGPPEPRYGHNPHMRPRGRGMRGGFNGNFHRGGGRPPFNRGGFRGGGGGPWQGRGRGGYRGRGGKTGECHNFIKSGRCDYGDKCVFKHTAR